MPSIDPLSLELRDGGDKTRQPPGIAHRAVKDGIEHFPAIVRGIAMKQILHHMRDVGTALVRAVDIVVVDAVFGKMLREALAVAALCR